MSLLLSYYQVTTYFMHDPDKILDKRDRSGTMKVVKLMTFKQC